MIVRNLHDNSSKLASNPVPAGKLFPAFGSTGIDSKTLLAAAAEFFGSASSGKSQEFLANNRQTGGE